MGGRHQQVNEILKHCLKHDEIFILGCDLNATPPGTNNGSTCETYNQITEHLSDAWASKNDSDPNCDGLTWDQEANPMCQTVMNSMFYGQKKLRWRCDYIFWKNSLKASADSIRVNLRSCKLALTQEEAASDHFAVVAEYDFFEV